MDMDVDPPILNGNSESHSPRVLPSSQDVDQLVSQITKLKVHEKQHEQMYQQVQYKEQHVQYNTVPSGISDSTKTPSIVTPAKQKQSYHKWIKPSNIAFVLLFAFVFHRIYEFHQELNQLRLENSVLQGRISLLEQSLHDYELSDLNLQEKSDVINTPVIFSKDAAKYKQLILNELNQYTKTHPKKIGRTRYSVQFVEGNLASITNEPVLCIEPCINDRTEEMLKECRKMKEDTNLNILGLALRRQKCSAQRLSAPSFSSYQIGSEARTFLSELFYENYDPKAPSITKCFENEQRIQELNDVLVSLGKK